MDIEAAIFPIPSTVALPGSSMQLHVFEPRYRQMIKDCVRRQCALGVAYGRPITTSKVNGFKGKPKDGDEGLNVNRQSYAPSMICGAGYLRILVELPDGRYLVQVDVMHRVRIVEVVQDLPYMLARVEVLPPDVSRSLADAEMFGRILAAADIILQGEAARFRALLGPQAINETSLASLVYGILQWFKVSAEGLQALLEDDSDWLRGERLLTWLHAFLQMTGMSAAFDAPPRQRRVRVKKVEGDAEHKIIRVGFREAADNSMRAGPLT